MIQHGFNKVTENEGYYLEKNRNTPYSDNGYIKYGYLVEYCKNIDGEFMSVMYAIAKDIDEAELFLMNRNKYMFEYPDAKYIG